MNVRVLIGSKKGAFVLESDSERRDWSTCWWAACASTGR